MPWQKFNVSDLAIGRSRVVQIDQTEILLSRSQKGVYACHAVCPHQKLSLENARVRGNKLLCPHHGAQFRLGDGKPVGDQLTSSKLFFYSVKEDADHIFVLIE